MHKKKLYLLMSTIIFLTTTAKLPQPVYGGTPSLKAKAHDFEKKRPELFDDGDMNKPIVEGNWIYYLSDKIDTLMSLGIPRKVSFDGDRTWEALSSYDAFLHSKFEKVGDYLYYSIVTDNTYDLVTRKLALYRVKTDGSDEGIVVPVGDYEIYKDKVYFQNPKDVKKHIIGMYYSADLDGSNIKKLSDEACGFLMIYNDRIYYSSYKAIDNPLSMQLYSMKLDGGDVRKESVLMDDYARKFTNNYHLGKIGQKVNQVTTTIDKNKKQFRNSSWGMTLPEVLKAEGLKKPFSYDSIEMPGKLYGKDVGLEMHFDGEGKLYSGFYIIRIGDFIPESTAKDMTYLYGKANKNLTEKYGKPIKLGPNYYQWNVGDTKITLRCSIDLGHAPVFFLNYSRLDQVGAYKLPPKPLTVSSTQDKNSNLDLLKQHLQYQNTGEGWAYYSEKQDNSTQDIIVSSEDLIHPELDAVISIQHFGKQKTDIRNVVRETLKFYFPKDYQAVYKMVEETYPEEKLANSYHDKIFDTSLRHMLHILEENYVPKTDDNPYLNKTYNFDNKTVEFKVNKDYGMLEIYIGK